MERKKIGHENEINNTYTTHKLIEQRVCQKETLFVVVNDTKCGKFKCAATGGIDLNGATHTQEREREREREREKKEKKIKTKQRTGINTRTEIRFSK